MKFPLHIERNKTSEEVFEIPLSVANNLKGQFAEKIAEAYLSYRVIPDFKKHYDYIRVFTPNYITGRYLDYKGGKSVDKYLLEYPEFSSHYKYRHKGSSSYPPELLKKLSTAGGMLKRLVLFPNFNRVLIEVKWTEWKENHFDIYIHVMDESLNVVSSINFLGGTRDELQERMTHLVRYLSIACFMSLDEVEKLVMLRKVLENIGYRPDYVILTANNVEKQRLNVISEEMKEKSFELPVLKIERIILVEVKSGKVERKITFTKNQRVLMRRLSSLDSIELLVLYIPIEDYIPLKEVQIITYNLKSKQKQRTLQGND